jgi:subtilisin family serine protease
MKTTTAVLLCVMMAGCATVRESYAPDGRKAFALNCSGTARGWDKCYSAAGEQCGAAGYDILDRNSEDKSVATAAGNNSGFGASGVRTKERTMLIACKR